MAEAPASASPPGGFTVKDSGRRATGPGGMLKEAVRKPCPTLIPTFFLWRLAEHMTKGAEKYDRNNWKKACSVAELEGFQDSAFRHLLQWLNGEADEDHAAAIVANIFMAEWTKEHLPEC